MTILALWLMRRRQDREFLRRAKELLPDATGWESALTVAHRIVDGFATGLSVSRQVAHLERAGFDSVEEALLVYRLVADVYAPHCLPEVDREMERFVDETLNGILAAEN